MIPFPPIASYRIQLRNGVDFDAVSSQLDYLAELGISHLYLSPIFAAATGSTHGYDVIDPTVIEPSLGGKAGFEALARAAHERDIGIILDIVPNHTAFTFDNPWLVDVLAHGASSRYARHFDIDWAAGPLVLPVLPDPFERMLADGAFSVAGGRWRFGDVSLPLAEGSGPAETSDQLRALHKAQHWRLRHWEAERDAITHRRFFNVTSLVGMRVEDEGVFEDTHRLIIELTSAGLVDGLRVDHIDGLADPAAYLEKLADVLPDTPVWVEKIVVGKETLPAGWKTVGTTGYEAARLIARLLTEPEGIETLHATWQQRTGITEEFDEALALAKRDILQNELAAELHQLVALALSALVGSARAEPGPESLREAITALLSVVPRYRTYFANGDGTDDDHALIAEMVDATADTLRSRTTLDAVAGLFSDGSNSAARTFVARFQQVSGALLAKAQEDTAGFRWTRYIAANEVGAEPHEPTVTLDEANDFVGMRVAEEMTLTSTHDTKRSEDSRMRLVAISHMPQAFAALADHAAQLDEAAQVSPQWQWYIVQSALAIWGAGEAVADRLVDHVLKAMREAKQTTFWTRPNAEVEDAATRFARAVVQDWRHNEPTELATLAARGDALCLAQLALKSLMPGFPDFYRGTEVTFLALTDPDNRLPVEVESLAPTVLEGLDKDKNALTRLLLDIRSKEAQFLANADTTFSRTGDTLMLRRSHDGRTLQMAFGARPVAQDRPIWQASHGGLSLMISWV